MLEVFGGCGRSQPELVHSASQPVGIPMALAKSVDWAGYWAFVWSAPRQLAQHGQTLGRIVIAMHQVDPNNSAPFGILHLSQSLDGYGRGSGQVAIIYAGEGRELG